MHRLKTSRNFAVDLVAVELWSPGLVPVPAVVQGRARTGGRGGPVAGPTRRDNRIPQVAGGIVAFWHSWVLSALLKAVFSESNIPLEAYGYCGGVVLQYINATVLLRICYSVPGEVLILECSPKQICIATYDGFALRCNLSPHMLVEQKRHLY